MSVNQSRMELFFLIKMRDTKKVSVWPCAHVGGSYYERPICVNKTVRSFFAPYNSNRVFPLDMASFAVNLKLLKESPKANFPFYSKANLEGEFLKYLVKVDELEATISNCSMVKFINKRAFKRM